MPRQQDVEMASPGRRASAASSGGRSVSGESQRRLRPGNGNSSSTGAGTGAGRSHRKTSVSSSSPTGESKEDGSSDSADSVEQVFRTFSLNRRAETAAQGKAMKWTNNSVTTGKYNAVTFVPKTIFEFFRIVANMYFLLISCLQAFTDLSPTNKYTTAGPLLIVLIISMIKQAVEDWSRHAADRQMNARTAHRVDERGAIHDIEWRNVVVGDILIVKEREELPADVVVLATSEEEGRCFIETANLDGETNLKRREAVKDVAAQCGLRGVGAPLRPDMLEHQAKEAVQLQGSIEYEEKNNSLYTFVGTMNLRAGGRPKTEVVPLGPASVILRGCMLRNCTFIVGLAIYTGADTKLMQNSRPTPSKQSNAYKVVNRCILLIFFTQFVMCLFSSVGFAAWSNDHSGGTVTYMGSVLPQDTVTFGETFKAFLTFIMLYNNLVPISLYVSLDMIKVLQAKFMEHDEAMCYTNEDTGEIKYAKVRTSDLNEDLGQIEYIFSDKTGTLTRNMMEFRKCSIGGTAYGFGTTEIGKAAAMRSGGGATPAASVSGLRPEQMERMSNPREAQVNFDPKIHFDDPRLLAECRRGGEKGMAVREFITMLAVCHTVIPERDAATGQIMYRASSPDEEALVKAAKCLGFDFVAPAPNLTVREKKSAKDTAPATRVYTVLNVNEFNSTRKRMSIVVRTPENQIVCYCKGADNVMFERSTSVMGSSLPVLTSHLKAFASEGLRTLVLARRVLDPHEYNTWNNQYREAAAALEHRGQKLMAVAEHLERDMQIVGATAIEDKLQEGVPDAIHDLAIAGIKIWVLTGDKVETAINIGYACKLLTQKMTLIHVDAGSLDEIAQQLNDLQNQESIRPLLARTQASDKLALIIDGTALTQIFVPSDAPVERREKAELLSRDLLRVARCCKAVVACRVSPAQKAAIVRLVRRNVTPAPMTLAIGDGANDVNMIQTAQVGVGISGQEGVQAVNSSDYAIAQFKFLKPLLLVHGRLNYQRISKVILYSFYKNIALVITLFLFNFYNGFSGASFYESFVMAGWNFFLALPIIVIGVFDVDVFAHVSMRHPALYISGQSSLDLNVWRFTRWIVNAVVHALMVFYMTMPLMGASPLSPNVESGLLVRGTLVYSCLLLLMNYKVALECRVWVEWFHFVLWFSLSLYFIFLVLYTSLTATTTPPGSFAHVAFEMFSLGPFWFALILVPTACIFLDVLASSYRLVFSPTPHDILRIHERYTSGKTPPRCPHEITITGDEGGPDEPMVLRGVNGTVDQQRSPHLGFAFNSATKESYFAHPGSSKRFSSKLLSRAMSRKPRPNERENPLHRGGAAAAAGSR